MSSKEHDRYKELYESAIAVTRRLQEEREELLLRVERVLLAVSPPGNTKVCKACNSFLDNEEAVTVCKRCFADLVK